MHTLSVPITDDGALLEVLITLPASALRALRQAGSPLPAPIPIRAIVDTAADQSCIDSRLMKTLAAGGSLPPLRFVFASVPALGLFGLAAEYEVTLSIVHPSGESRSNLVLRSHPVLDQPLAKLGYEGLLGRDVLNQLAFYWDGPGKLLSLAY